MDIRDERPDDAEAVAHVNRLAFGREAEGRIVHALREHGAAALSLVAVDEGAVVGHILFSPAETTSAAGVALAPMAVLPASQRRGIGSALVHAGIARLRQAGCPFIVLIGHPGFYPRFGFEPAAAHGLTCDWDVPSDAFMVLVLDPAVRGRLGGRVRFLGSAPARRAATVDSRCAWSSPLCGKVVGRTGAWKGRPCTCSRPS